MGCAGTEAKVVALYQGRCPGLPSVFFSGAAICEIDKQGRVLIPANQRDYAQLEKDVVVIGVSTRVEIWSKDRWDKYSAAAASSYEEIAEKLIDSHIDL